MGICRRVLACIVIGSGDPNTPTPQVRKLYLAANTHTGSKLNQTQFADLTWSKWAAGSTLLVWQHLERLRKMTVFASRSATSKPIDLLKIMGNSR